MSVLWSPQMVLLLFWFIKITVQKEKTLASVSGDDFGYDLNATERI